MKAIVQETYGSPDVLHLEEIARPVPIGDQVLVRVSAAAVNPADVHFMTGLPLAFRPAFGLRKPKNPVRGIDVAGTVEAAGPNVTQLRPGDEVFGWSDGTFAEYVCAEEARFVPKPANLTLEQAAAVPLAACTALQALRDVGHLRSGQTVLINGASGGVGTFAVQLAKAFGAEVTGVCSTRNVEMVRLLGAEHVIDYTQEDFTRSTQRNDLILDQASNHSFSELRHVLTLGGILVAIGQSDPGDRWIGPTFRIVSRYLLQRMRPFLAKVTKEDLILLRDLIESDKVTPIIDRTYPLKAVPEALAYVAEGHARAKVVITI